MKLHVYSSSRKTAHALCRKLIEQIEQKEGDFHLAIPGGKMLIPFYIALAGKFKKDIPWERLFLYWVDEICVPPTNPASNYGLVKQLLLNNVPLADSHIFRIYGENDPEKEICRYSKLIQATLPSIDNIPIFDWIILGVNDDGQTSSIFSDQQSDCQENYGITLQEKTGQKRIALTGNPTLHAHNISIYITGLEKAPLVKAILIDSDLEDNYTAKFIIQQYASLDFFLDRSAMSLTKDWEISALIDSDYPEAHP